MSRLKIVWNFNQIFDGPRISFLGLFGQIHFSPFRTCRSSSNCCFFHGLSCPIFRLEIFREWFPINPGGISIEIQVPILKTFFGNFPNFAILDFTQSISISTQRSEGSFFRGRKEFWEVVNKSPNSELDQSCFPVHFYLKLSPNLSPNFYKKNAKINSQLYLIKHSP